MSHRRSKTKAPTAAETRDACLDEAIRGMQSGAHLAKAGDFGRARSLDLLAYETAVQGMVYHMVAMGWATFDRGKRGDLLYFSERALRNHELKQFLIALFDPVIRNLARDVAGHVERGETPGIGPDYAVRELSMEATEPPPPVERFNAMKNEGLYPHGGGTARPSEVTEEDYSFLHDRIHRRVRVLRAIARSELPEEVVDEFRKQAGELAKQGRAFDEEFLYKLRKVKAKGFKVAEVLEEDGEARFHDPKGVWQT